VTGLIGRRIRPWTVVARKKNAQDRNVYLLRHADGFLKDVKGHVLNALLTEARVNGVTVQ
jgi:hypothetical protein